MTAPEMHAWFRQYAQQMGMQNVRAILPEQIDTVINTSTLDIVDEIVKTKVGTTNDRIISDNSKLATINALRTLYRIKSKDIEESPAVVNYKTTPLTITSTDFLGTSEEVLYFIDFSIRYSHGADEEEKITKLFPIRIIDDSCLADVLNDWILAPRLRTPVMVVYSDADELNKTVFDIYLGENNEAEVASVARTLKVKDIRMSYIKKPNKVSYMSDVNGTDVDSDLPEQLQIPMLKHAVDLYRISIQGSIFAAQQQSQNQQREAIRNNARPDNEGY